MKKKTSNIKKNYFNEFIRKKKNKMGINQEQITNNQKRKLIYLGSGFSC